MAATFKYFDNLGIEQSQSFDILSIKGFGKPFKWRLVPPIVFNGIDKSKSTEYKGFQRIIGITLRVLDSNEDFLRAFFQASQKSITYLGEEVQIAWEEIKYEVERLDGFRKTKRYDFEITESTVKTEW